jgi:tetratricopeptide (TPR) repeat protein
MMDCLIMDLNKGCAVSSKTKEIQQIIHYFRKSWLLFPESYRTMNNLGDLYLNFGNNPDSALLFLAGAYKLKPESFYVRFNIARCFDFNNEMDKAEYWYLSAIQVNPDIPKTHELLNNLRARKLDK